jgi:aminoglycoside phosphotransferase family enzyme
MIGKAKRIVKLHRVPKAMVTAAQIYYAVLPLARQDDVVLIDAEYDVEYLKEVRRCLEKTLNVSSVAVGHVSDKAIEKADRLSEAFRKRRYCDEKDPSVLEFVRLIHPARRARFIP